MDLLDLSQVNSMSSGASETFLGIVDRFLVSSQDQLDRLEGEPQGAVEIMHQLKGASGTLGLQELHRHTVVCEASLRQGESLGVQWLESLRQLLEESVVAVRQHVEAG